MLVLCDQERNLGRGESEFLVRRGKDICKVSFLGLLAFSFPRKGSQLHDIGGGGRGGIRESIWPHLKHY